MEFKAWPSKALPFFPIPLRSGLIVVEGRSMLNTKHVTNHSASMEAETKCTMHINLFCWRNMQNWHKLFCISRMKLDCTGGSYLHTHPWGHNEHDSVEPHEPVSSVEYKINVMVSSQRAFGGIRIKMGPTKCYSIHQDDPASKKLKIHSAIVSQKWMKYEGKYWLTVWRAPKMQHKIW